MIELYFTVPEIFRLLLLRYLLQQLALNGYFCFAKKYIDHIVAACNEFCSRKEMSFKFFQYCYAGELF